MLQLLLGFVIVIAVTVVPVMIAARLVGAQETGFGSAVFALFLQLCLALRCSILVQAPVSPSLSASSEVP